MNDTLSKLGKIIESDEQRDAIHIAVAPVVAARKLFPGQEVGFAEEGDTTTVGPSEKAIGIVDPFLKRMVLPGEGFWMFLFPGLDALVSYGVRPRHVMVYMLIGYWPGETHEDRDHRRRRLREFGALPYPMPYRRTPELVGFQRWVIGAYDKRIAWAEWERARYQPRQLREGVA